MTEPRKPPQSGDQARLPNILGRALERALEKELEAIPGEEEAFYGHVAEVADAAAIGNKIARDTAAVLATMKETCARAQEESATSLTQSTTNKATLRTAGFIAAFFIVIIIGAVGWFIARISNRVDTLADQGAHATGKVETFNASVVEVRRELDSVRRDNQVLQNKVHVLESEVRRLQAAEARDIDMQRTADQRLFQTKTP